jgi:transposase
MERRQFTREFKLEAVRLIKERGVSYAKAAEDLGVHPTQLRNWVKQLADDPQHAFPGHGQLKPEQLEIAQLKREVARLKAERDILKKAAAYFAKESREVRFCCEAPGDLAGRMVMRGARCLAGWVLCVADTTAQSAQPER